MRVWSEAVQILCQGHLSPWLEEATTLSDEGYGVAGGRGIKEQQLDRMGLRSCVRKLGAWCSVAVPSLTLLSHVTWVIPIPPPPHPTPIPLPKPHFPSDNGNELKVCSVPFHTHRL